MTQQSNIEAQEAFHDAEMTGSGYSAAERWAIRLERYMYGEDKGALDGGELEGAYDAYDLGIRALNIAANHARAYAEAAELNRARYHLAKALCNQGIEWAEAQEGAKIIEDRWAHFLSGHALATKLHDAAYPYEDM